MKRRRELERDVDPLHLEHLEYVRKVKKGHSKSPPTCEKKIYDPDPKTGKCRCIYCIPLPDDKL